VYTTKYSSRRSHILQVRNCQIASVRRYVQRWSLGLKREKGISRVNHKKA